MKKILLLAFAATALFFTACSSDDDNPTRDEQLKQRLIEVGTWKNYGHYKVQREYYGNMYHYDTTYLQNTLGNGVYLWTFKQDFYNINKDNNNNLKLFFHIENDTLYSRTINSSSFESKRHITFSGDSCNLTGYWNDDDYHLIYVLHSK